MRATIEQMTTLLQMQQIDLELLKRKKELEALPQRATILATRQKKRAIEQKKDQVAKLRATAEAKAAKLEDEDASLAEKQRNVQQSIDEQRGDYRSVEVRTKELNGFAKRRNVLEEELGKVGEDLAKIEGVQNQVMSALDGLEKQEATAIASFQQEGGNLQAGIARLTAERSSLESSLPDELREAYQQTAARTGGVAVGRLMDGRCGVCRNVIDGGRLIDLKTQAPLGTCPHCKRLLVVA